MKQIELRRLAVIDLSITYARKLEGNKIRHYRISYTQHILSKMAQLSDTDILKTFIEKEEGEPIEIKMLPTVYNGQYPTSTEKVDLVEGAALQVKDVTNILLKDNPEIKKSLKKNEVKSLLYQYNEKVPLSKRIFNPFRRFVNFFIYQINKVLARLQGSSIEKIHRCEKWGSFIDVRQVPYLQTRYPIERHVIPCTFLSVAFEEQDLEKAAATLIADLKKLNDEGLIMGHLAMPSMILLADTVGSGQNVYNLFCFLFVDNEKILEKTGKTHKDLPNGYLISRELLGIKTECYEGSINWLDGIDPATKYDIEVVNVSDFIQEEIVQVCQENYLNTREAVNAAAAKQKRTIGKIKKIESGEDGFRPLTRFENTDPSDLEAQRVVNHLNRVYNSVSEKK